MVGWQQEAYGIHFGEGFVNHIVQAPAQKGARAVNSWCVNEDELRVGAGHDGANITACRLRPIGGNHHFAANQRVDERRLSHIWPAHNGDKAGAEAFWYAMFWGDVVEACSSRLEIITVLFFACELGKLFGVNIFRVESRWVEITHESFSSVVAVCDGAVCDWAVCDRLAEWDERAEFCSALSALSALSAASALSCFSCLS